MNVISFISCTINIMKRHSKDHSIIAECCEMIFRVRQALVIEDTNELGTEPI